MPIPARVASRIMSPLLTTSAARPRTIVAPFESREAPVTGAAIGVEDFDVMIEISH